MSQQSQASAILFGGSELSESAFRQPASPPQQKVASKLSIGLKEFQHKIFSIIDQIKINNQYIVHNLQFQLNNALQSSISSITAQIDLLRTTITNLPQPSALAEIESQPFSNPQHSNTKESTDSRLEKQQNTNLDSLKTSLQQKKLKSRQQKRSGQGIDFQHIQSLIGDLVTRTFDHEEKKAESFEQKIRKKSQGRIDVLRRLETQNSLTKQSCRKYQAELEHLKEEDRKKREEIQRYQLLQREKLKDQYNQELAYLQKKCQDMTTELQKAQRQKINFSKFVSNHQQTHPQAFVFLAQQIQAFSNRHLVAAELVFQSDQFCQDLSNYLNLKEPFPAVIIFYTHQQTIFGLYSTHITPNKDKNSSKAFLFNASRQKVFVGNRSQKNTWINPASFKDNMLVVGNRELVLKSKAMNLVRVFCGSIFGEECFQVKRRQELTGSTEEQVPLKRVQLHRLIFGQEKQ